MLISINDRKSYAITSREYTDEGYLIVPGRVAKTGTQDYLARELGLDGDPNRIVKVFRPADEVFNIDSLATYQSADITIEHPSEMVSCDTYKKLSVGTVTGAAVQDGDFVKANIIIKDKEAIAAVESGKVQLSAGYTAIYDDDVPEGADYEFIQRDIKINHVALVDAARAGPQARLFDNKTKVIPMKTVTLDSGRTVELADAATASLVADSLERLQDKVKTANDKIADMEKDMEKEKAEKDMAMEDMEKEKKKSSDSAIELRIKSVVAAKDASIKIAGKDFTCDSLVPLEINRAALAVARPSVDWAAKSDDYILAAFDMEMEKESDDEDEKESDKKKAKDSYTRLSMDAATKQKDAIGIREKVIDSMESAHRKTVGE